MTPAFLNLAREAQDAIDSMLAAVRRGDHQAARALARSAMVAIERATRELPEVNRG